MSKEKLVLEIQQIIYAYEHIRFLARERPWRENVVFLRTVPNAANDDQPEPIGLCSDITEEFNLSKRLEGVDYRPHRVLEMSLDGFQDHEYLSLANSFAALKINPGLRKTPDGDFLYVAGASIDKFKLYFADAPMPIVPMN